MRLYSPSVGNLRYTSCVHPYHYLFCLSLFYLLLRPPPCPTLFPYTTLFRSPPRPAPRRSAGVRCPQSSPTTSRSEEHTSELQSRGHLVCRLLLEKKKESKRW